MEKIKSYSEHHRLLHGLPTQEHELFFAYLAISPSYFKAHQYLTGSAKDSKNFTAILKWDIVLKTYSTCGDVFTTTFDQWWTSCGQSLFYIPNKEGGYSPEGPIKLLVNKINKETLIKGLSLVNWKSFFETKNNKKIANWRLGVEASLRSKWNDELRENRGKTAINVEARDAMGMLVSKKLKETLYLAENAARGEFPSTVPINTGLKFNSHDQISAQRLSSQAHIHEFSKIEREGLPSPFKKAARKFARNRKIIKKEVERQLEQRLEEEIKKLRTNTLK